MSQYSRQEVERQKAATGYHLPTQDCLGCGGGATCFPLPSCPYCYGTGVLKHAPWASEPWSEVLPDLWVGAHEYAVAGLGNVWVGPETLEAAGFDLVVSMHRPDGSDVERPVCNPPEGTEHMELLFEDDPFALRDPLNLEAVMEAAEFVAQAVDDGRKTLVRCHAGMNRSSLVAALAMVQMGYEPTSAIMRIRATRTRFALFNTSFVALIKAQQANPEGRYYRQEDTDV